jgi:hypothetical protein
LTSKSGIDSGTWSARAAREAIESFDHRLRAGADAVVARQIHPAHGSRGIDQELRRPGDDLLGVRLVPEIIQIDGLGLGIAEDGEGPADLGDVLAEGGRGIGADRDQLDAAGFELGKVLLETP